MAEGDGRRGAARAVPGLLTIYDAHRTAWRKRFLPGKQLFLFPCARRVRPVAGVPVVMPVHHHPRRSGSEVRALCEQLGEREGVRVLVADEGKVFELDAL